MKCLVAIFAIFTIVTPTFAYSPFDQILRSSADLAVSDIFQDASSKDIELRICNVGNAMDSESDMLVWAQKKGGKIVKNIIQWVRFDAGACRDFRVAGASDFNIIGAEKNYFAGAALLIGSRKENNLANNKVIKYLSVTSVNTTTPGGNYNPWTPVYSNTSGADFVIRNIGFNRNITLTKYYGSQNLSNAVTAELCNMGASVNTSQGVEISFQSNNNTVYYTTDVSNWAANDCRTVGIEVSRLGITNIWWYNFTVKANTSGTNRISESNYSNNQSDASVYVDYNGSNTNNNAGNGSVQVINPNGGEVYNSDTYSSNDLILRARVTSYYKNIDWVDFELYRMNGANYGNGTLYRTERVYGAFSWYNGDYISVEKTIDRRGFPDDDYRLRVVAHDASTYNTTYTDWSDGIFRIGAGTNNKTDLEVRDIFQDSTSRKIIAKICNKGVTMPNSSSIQTDFTLQSSRKVNSQFVWMQLNRDQCNDISINPEDIGITSFGTYSMTVKTDVNNTIDDANRENNTKTASLSITSGSSLLPDLVVENLKRDNANSLVAHICNRGGNMTSYTSISAQFTVTDTNRTAIQYVTTQLSSNQCADIQTSLSGLNMYQFNQYLVKIDVDNQNQIAESNEFNNSLSQRIYLDY